MIGTPDEVVKRITAAQKACSFSEITIVPQFGHMPYDVAQRSVKLFAQEVLPAMHKLDAALHPGALPVER
jgi:alkanesulfonate monooxygenase SsuD/methylene tetrahydromethanopterin reductase-like flavin-dependent oxidoreductase (luciferase family)